MAQPSGELATIKWITVGGRTSAYVAELQNLPPGSMSMKRKAKVFIRAIAPGEQRHCPHELLQAGDETDLPDLTDSDVETSKWKVNGDNISTLLALTIVIYSHQLEKRHSSVEKSKMKMRLYLPPIK